MNILIALADAAERPLFEQALVGRPWRIEWACDGTAALARLASDTPPLVAVLDSDLPGLGGLEVCREIRAAAGRPYVFVLLLIDRPDPERAARALEAGADDCVGRPLHAGWLAARIRLAANSAETARAYERLLEEVGGCGQAALAQQTALLDLAAAAGGNSLDAIDHIVRTDAAVLDVERVSYWSLRPGPERLVCESLFLHSRGHYERGAELEGQSFPSYFEALRKAALIDAADALSDPRTAELAGPCLTPLGIGARLDVPVWSQGRLVGVVCHEHVGGRRAWTPEERKFAVAIGQLVSRALEVGERQRAEEALRESEARLRNITDAIPGVVYQYRLGADGSQRFTFVSGGSVDLVGLRPEELMSDVNLAWSLVVDEDRDALWRSILDSARNRAAWSHDYRVRLGDGRVKWIRGSSIPEAPAPDGSIVWNGIFLDVTELKRLEAQLRIGDRLAALGTLAAGIAHQINNPLTAVISNVEYAAEALARGDLSVAERAEISRALAEARDGARRVSEIGAALRTFARSEGRVTGAVDLQRAIDAALTMVGNEIRHRARLLEDRRAVPAVVGNEAQITQVFVNLLLNASQAAPERRPANEIRLSTWSDGERVFAEVRDNGTGIPESIRGRIFDPFFTTAPVGGGIGMGLAVCHGIVTAMGGEIAVETEIGRGSAFRVILPAAPPEARAPESGSPGGRRRLRILLVDDEPMLLDALDRLLRERHEVVTAASASEATHRLRGGAFDVVLCDLMMPGRSGADLYEEVARSDPSLAERFVFMSGGMFSPAVSAFAERVADRVVSKPVDTGVLERLLEQVADRARPDR